MGAVALARVKGALAGLAGTAADAQLQVELGAAEAQIAALCGWPPADNGVRSFLSATFTLYPAPLRQSPRMLPLPFGPSAVTSVHYDPRFGYGASTLVSSLDYMITPEGLWRTVGYWPRSERSLRVVCTAGWASGSAPDEVEAAVVAQTVHRWRVLRPGQGVAAASGRDGSVTRDALTAVPELVRQLAALSPAWRWSAHVG